MPVTIGGSGPITGVTSINTTVSDTELGYLDGVTSALQTQINAKANDSSQGLYLITPTSIANSGGSASASGGAVTFSGVTSVSLNGVFTSVYDNYRVVVQLASSINDVLLSVRMRASGTDNTSASYDRQRFTAQNTAVTATSNTGGTSMDVGYAQTATDNCLFIEFVSPQLAIQTSLLVFGNYGGRLIEYYANSFTANTQFDGFTFYPSSGNITGTLRVYGYKN